jgi:hypothetical protein
VQGLPRLAPFALAVVALAGCGSGGGGSAQSSPQKLVALYIADFNRGDGKAACALLTSQAQAGVPHLSNDITSPDCEGAVGELSRLSEPLRAPRIAIRQQGNQAVAVIKSRRPPYQSQALLDHQDGGWLIAFPPALLEHYRKTGGN